MTLPAFSLFTSFSLPEMLCYPTDLIWRKGTSYSLHRTISLLRFTGISLSSIVVLFWCDGHCCQMHCELFKIYCAPSKLVFTRTWICRLNFGQRPIFSLTSLRSQTRNPQLKVPPGVLVLGIFMSWKNPSTSAGFEPANLGSRGEHVTSRPPRPT